MSCATMTKMQQCPALAVTACQAPPRRWLSLGRWLNLALLGTAATAALAFVGALALAGHGAPPIAVVELPRVVITGERLPQPACPVPTDALTPHCPLPLTPLE